jgi:hypothetical protein
MDVGSSPMEKIYRPLGTYVAITLTSLCLLSCTSSPPNVSDEDVKKFEDINKEYEKVVQVEVASKPVKAVPIGSAKKPKTKTPEPKWAMETKKRQPEIEDTEGFDGRRPKLDPFRPGEAITLSVKFFNVNAGDITLKVLPFKVVNGRQAYHLQAVITTNKTFSMFYSVNNMAETFLDFETFIPQTLTYNARESKRQKEAKTFFDWEKNQATQWRHEISKDKGEQKKKISWALEPFSQNMLSALFYMRAFTLTPGKKLAFRVADEGKNYVFKGDVLRREEIDTVVGKLKTIVVQPEFTAQGSLKPTGQNLIWLTDDDRKLIVRIESKVKIGTLVGQLKTIEGPK